MFSNRSQLFLVRNVVNSQKRSKYDFFYLLSNNNWMTKDLKSEHNLKLKLYFIKRMHIIFNPSFRLRTYFTWILNYPKNPSVPAISLKNRKMSFEKKDLVPLGKKNEKSQLCSVDMDFISDYLYGKEWVDLSVKMLKEDFRSNSQWFLKLIKCEGELDKTGVENVLQNFNFLRKKIKWDDEKERAEMGSTKEVQEFLKALQIYVSELSSQNLIAAVSFIVTFGIPTDHDVAVLAILRLLDKLDSLEFREKIFLYYLLKYFHKTDLVNELSLGLKQRIQEQVTEKLHIFSALDIKDALHFASFDSTKLNDNDLKLLFNAAFEADQKVWDSRYGFSSCLKIIHKLKDEDVNIYREKLYKKLYEYMLEGSYKFSSNLCEFAVVYAMKVHWQTEPYNEEFFDDIIDSIIKNKQTLDDWQALLFSMDVLRHLRNDVIQKMKYIFELKPLLAYHSFYLFKNIIVLIIDTNCSSNWKKPWPQFEMFLENLINFKDLSFWSEEDLLLSLRVVAALASVEIFSDNILELLAKRVNDVETDPRIGIPFMYIALNQAVTVLHPTYPKPFLTEEILSSLQSRMQCSPIPDHLHSFNTNVIEVFESVVPNRDFFLANQKSKLEHKISVVTAINGSGNFFNFSSIKEKGQIYIEDIILPPDYRLILVLLFSENHYTRNMRSLKSVARIRVKTLNKMGYNVFYILYDSWINMSSHQKINLMKNRLDMLRIKIARSLLEET